MDAYAGSATALIADVDCTAGGKDLCEQNGVRGYPSIKYGDPADLQDYQGGRDFDSLKKFAKENLKPMCSPANIDLCDDEKKAEIGKFQAMPPEELTAAIEEKQAAIKAAGETFDEEVKKLQATYEQLQKDKEETIKSVKESGLGLMQAVAAAAA